MLPYFLRTRLNKLPEVKQAVEGAYRAHYDGLADEIGRMMMSKEAQEKQVGLVLAGQEYENLYTALEMDLKSKGSIVHPYLPLSLYLDSTKEQERGLKIGQLVLAGLEGYPAESLKGPMGSQMVGVADNIANRQLSLKRYSEAEKTYRRALGLAEGLTAQALDAKTKAVGIAGIYLQLGAVAQGQWQWTQAEEYCHKALEIFIEFKDRHKQARTYHQLGAVAQGQRQWTQAEEYYQKALEIFIEFKDRHKQANTYHQLGTVAQEQRQWTQAEEYYQKALEIFIEFKDLYSQASSYHQLGLMAQEQRQWTQAEKYYHKALEIKIEFKDRYSQASTYNNLGMMAEEQRQWTQAEEYYHKALEILIEFKDRYDQAGIYHNLGLMAGKRKKWDIARENLSKALEIFFEFGDQHKGAIALGSLARLWQATTDPRVLTEVARVLSIAQEDARKLLEGKVKQ